MDSFNPMIPMFTSSAYHHSFPFAPNQEVPIHLPAGEGGFPLDQPLSVAVNIEYTLDESKFVDLHTGEPTLIIDPSYWKAKPMELITTSTPKKKQERNKSKIVPPHVWLPSITRSTCMGGNEDKMVDLLDAEADRLSSASYSPSSSSDYLNVSDTNAPRENESHAMVEFSPESACTSTNNSSPEESVDLSYPSPETLQAALDALLSEVSLLSCATDSKETVPVLKEKEERKPSSAIPQYHSHHASEVNYQYYGIV